MPQSAAAPGLDHGLSFAEMLPPCVLQQCGARTPPRAARCSPGAPLTVARLTRQPVSRTTCRWQHAAQLRCVIAAPNMRPRTPKLPPRSIARVSLEIRARQPAKLEVPDAAERPQPPAPRVNSAAYRACVTGQPSMQRAVMQRGAPNSRACVCLQGAVRAVMSLAAASARSCSMLDTLSLRLGFAGGAARAAGGACRSDFCSTSVAAASVQPTRAPKSPKLPFNRALSPCGRTGAQPCTKTCLTRFQLHFCCGRRVLTPPLPHAAAAEHGLTKANYLL